MRPLELRMRGFRSYHGEDYTFDFRDRRLVGIVGPIGSGKSTILDAVAFALYGRTARIGRGTKSLINQRVDHGAVALRFSVDGTVWEAQRSLRKKGQSQHALYRLAHDADDADRVEQVLQEGPVNERIEELLGLDFSAFSRSVLLAQNQFDQFLSAAPRDRDKVLKGVFGHDRVDRMRERARERSREAEIEAEKAAVRLQSLEEASVSLDERIAAVAAARHRIEVLEEHESEIRALAATSTSTAAESKALDDRDEELARVEDRLPDVEGTAAVVEAVRAAAEQRATTAAAMGAAHQELAELEAVFPPERLEADRATVETTGKAVARRDAAVKALSVAKEQTGEQSGRLVAATQTAEGAAAGVDADAAALAVAEEHVANAVTALGAAEAALHDVKHENMAAVLQGELVVGEPCPVCSQPVDVLPTAAVSPEVDRAEAAVTEAAAVRERAEAQRVIAAGAVEAARARAAAGQSAVETTTADLEAAQGREEAAEGALAELDQELSTLLGAGDVEVLVDDMKRELRSAEESLDLARKSVTATRRDNDEAIEADQTTKRRMGDLRVEVVTIASLLGAVSTPQEDDIEATVSLIDEVRSRYEQERERSGRRRAELAQTRAVASARMEELRELLGLDGSIDEAFAAARAAVALHDEEIERLQDRLAGAGQVRADRDAAIADRDVHGRLAADLTDARFIRFLLDDERQRLADLGSEHFQRLSDGRYRFTDDGAFAIVDLTTAESVRKADSLSGGETFLASLGLALALAEMVARTGGRLEAFFLDEGFGSLDPEHLDLAMEGIESLAAERSDRLVVVVSHVAEMRHRIEDLIALERDAATGDTRVIRA